MSVNILWRPLGYFRNVIAREPKWLNAATPLVLEMALVSAGGYIALIRGQAAMSEALAQAGFHSPELPPFFGIVLTVFSSMAGAAILFSFTTGAIVVLDLLYAQSRRVRRLVECSALAYWSQFPWSVVSVWALLLEFYPEPLRLPGGISQLDLPRVITDYQHGLATSSFMLTTKLVGVYFGLWLVALQACALRVVSGFTVGGAWAAGVFLGSVFVVVPWAVQRFW